VEGGSGVGGYGSVDVGGVANGGGVDKGGGCGGGNDSEWWRWGVVVAGRCCHGGGNDGTNLMTSPRRGLKDASNEKVPAWLCARWVCRCIYLRTHIWTCKTHSVAAPRGLDNGSGTLIDADPSHGEPVASEGGSL